MKIRKVTSFSLAICFVLEILTGVVLYIVPHGRIAYWADWKFWGLTKTQWGDIHITVSVFFLLASGLHLYYNWKALISYLKTKAKQTRGVTSELSVAVIITAFVVAGTLIEIPPFSWILAGGEAIKDRSARIYGEPPYGHAELSSLSVFCKKVGFDLKEAEKALNAAGITFDSSDKTIGQIAKANQTSPNGIYTIIQKELGKKRRAKTSEMSETAAPGTGNRTIADICAEYSIKIPDAMRSLKAKGIVAEPELTLKEAAKKNSRHPTDIYLLLREVHLNHNGN